MSVWRHVRRIECFRRRRGKCLEKLEPRAMLAATFAITEVNYAPYDPIAEFGDVGQGGSDFEFIEVMNTGDAPLNLQGIEFTRPFGEGVEFVFPDSVLGPGERTVIVEDTNAFRSRYGDAPSVAGQWLGGLSNNAETITVEEGNATIIQFRYKSGGKWPSRAAGVGASLEIVEPVGALLDYADPDSWNSSSKYGGTPGAPPADRSPRVVINEVLAHTDRPQIDFVELLNVTTDEEIDISGWYLTDMSTTTPFDFSIAPNTTISAGGFQLLSEADFNPGGGELPTDFALSETGDEVWLISAEPDGKPGLFMDRVRFEETLNGVTVGRIPDGAPGNELHPLRKQTPGASNLTTPGDVHSAHYQGNIVITEVQYHPPDDDVYKEFIELTNVSPVFDAAWIVTGAVGVNVIDPAKFELAAGEVAVLVAFDPEVDTVRANEFRAYYGISDDVNLIGPWDADDGEPDELGNGGEKITLRQPVDDDVDILHAPIDQVDYNDKAPWPAIADGRGASLQRRSNDDYGNVPETWQPWTPNPGNEDIDLSQNDELVLDMLVAGRVDQDGSFVRGSTDVDVFRFTPSSTGMYEINANAADGSPLDPFLRVFSDDGETELAFNDDIDETINGNSQVTINLEADREYFVTVAGTSVNARNYVPATGRGLAAGSVGPYELSISSATVNPLPWHNAALPEDVDGNGIVTPLDALLVINALNDPDVGLGELARDADGPSLIDEFTGNRYWVDVEISIGPNVLTPFDALTVINRLNAANEAEGENASPPQAIAVNRITAVNRSHFASALRDVPVERYVSATKKTLAKHAIDSIFEADETMGLGVVGF